MNWYLFKVGRIAFVPKSVFYALGASKVEGNNRWRHLLLGFWWRNDPTGDGTKD